MNKIVHASRLEKCKTLLKKAKIAKQKRKSEFNQLTEEEQQEVLKKRSEKTLDEILRLLEWDYNHDQLPVSKFFYFSEKIKEKLAEEIPEQEKFRLEKLLEAIQ